MELSNCHEQHINSLEYQRNNFKKNQQENNENMNNKTLSKDGKNIHHTESEASTFFFLCLNF